MRKGMSGEIPPSALTKYDLRVLTVAERFPLFTKALIVAPLMGEPCVGSTSRLQSTPTSTAALSIELDAVEVADGSEAGEETQASGTTGCIDVTLTGKLVTTTACTAAVTAT